MTISEMRKRLQNPHIEAFYSDWTEFLQRVFSIYITLALSKTPLSANHVTILNCFLIIPIAWLLGLYEAGPLFLAAFLVFLHMTIDCVDGELARLRSEGSVTGLFLDRLNTAIVYPGCFAAIGYGVWRTDGRVLPLFIGFLAGFACMFLRITYGNIILSAVDGLMSRKARADRSMSAQRAALPNQSGKEGVAGDFRRQVRGKSRLVGFCLDVADVILTRSMGLVLMVLAMAFGRLFDWRLSTPISGLTVAEMVMAGYAALALAATVHLVIKSVRTRYPEQVLSNLEGS